MPRGALSEETVERETVRVCGACQRAKSIRGVWYLVAGRPSPFMCEACFSARPLLRASS